LLRFLQSFVRIEIDAYADLTRWSICLNVNNPCRETILSSWLPAHFLRNFDEYLHKLAHLWRDIRGDLEARAWKETALGLQQASCWLTNSGDAVLEWPFLGKPKSARIYHGTCAAITLLHSHFAATV